MNQLSLFGSAEPVVLPELPGIDDMPAWNATESAWCAFDAAFPIEEVRCRHGLIFLRHVDHVWLWGARGFNGETRHGKSFMPLRKWGAAFVALTREEAIMAAEDWLEGIE